MANGLYDGGKNVPRIHPDDDINAGIVIEALSNALDETRMALGKVASLQLAEPANQQVKAEAVRALRNTSPGVVFEAHPNYG